MRTVQDYIAIIRQNSSKITKDFGIKTLRIFGSVSRNEQTEQSDLDICVETETPNPFLLADLKEFLEGLFKCSVDVVRIHKNMYAIYCYRRKFNPPTFYAVSDKFTIFVHLKTTKR